MTKVATLFVFLTVWHSYIPTDVIQVPLPLHTRKFSIIKFSSRIFSYSRCAGILINTHLAYSKLARDR